MASPELPNPFMHVGSSASTSEWFYNMLDVRLLDRTGKTVNLYLSDGSKAPIGCPTEKAAIELFTELREAWQRTWMRWREEGAIR